MVPRIIWDDPTWDGIQEGKLCRVKRDHKLVVEDSYAGFYVSVYTTKKGCRFTVEVNKSFLMREKAKQAAESVMRKLEAL